MTALFKRKRLKRTIYIIISAAFLYYFKSIHSNARLSSISALEEYRKLLSVALKEISDFEKFDCEALINGNLTDKDMKKAKQWKYSTREDYSILKAVGRTQRCNYLKSHYGFNLQPLSAEEEEFPIAYGILTHKWADQVFYMMSAVYHPQNAYCMAVDNGSSADFKSAMQTLQECFPNVHVMIAERIRYCGYTVLTAVHACVRHLALLKHNWKYYQYLSGVDLPLRTNREMVRILKRLNGSFNAEVKPFQPWRLINKTHQKPPYNVKMFKASLSATFSRESANFMATSKQSLSLLEYLNGTFCPDESYWMTMAGNYDKIPMPGSINATKFLAVQQKRWQKRWKKDDKEDAKAIPFYISRFQSWFSNPWRNCKGKYVSASCVFGVGDVPSLVQRPQLVAHKFYHTFEPGAFFCVYKAVRERAIRDIDNFDDRPYGDLPGPRITRGQSVTEWFKKAAERSKRV